jgi:hypothetical protein
VKYGTRLANADDASLVLSFSNQRWKCLLSNQGLGSSGGPSLFALWDSNRYETSTSCSVTPDITHGSETLRLIGLITCAEVAMCHILGYHHTQFELRRMLVVKQGSTGMI